MTRVQYHRPLESGVYEDVNIDLEDLLTESQEMTAVLYPADGDSFFMHMFAFVQHEDDEELIVDQNGHQDPDNGQADDESTRGDAIPGFGASATVAGLGGIGYKLKRWLSGDADK